jgi:hypothetical protein
MLRRPLWLVVAAELLAAIGDHFFFFGFFAVLAAALNAPAVGLPASPLRAMRSSLPASMRLRLAAMLAYRPGGFLAFTFCRLSFWVLASGVWRGRCIWAWNAPLGDVC